MAKKMSKLDLIAMILLIIGGINWALVGVLNFNLVRLLFGWTGILWAVYLLVGFSAVYALIKFPWKK